ncbi:hypothetical protein RHECNPAF_4310041 [Rhizobium etli CNPAF512]|nr:hypothetical protein RHECNPAF_4310041 [Rhizobium etli CNPAF512]
MPDEGEEVSATFQASRSRLFVDIRLGDLGEIAQRFLPAEIASLRRDEVGYAGLGDFHFGAHRNLLQRHGDFHFAGEVRIIELVGVADQFARDEFKKFAAESMAVAGREIAEGHSEGAADGRFQMMHGAEKTVRRKPFGERVCLDEGAIDLFRAGRENAVQAYGVRHGGDPLMDGMNELRTDKPLPIRHGIDLFCKKNRAQTCGCQLGMLGNGSQRQGRTGIEGALRRRRISLLMPSAFPLMLECRRSGVRSIGLKRRPARPAH